jgi:hypothetical protein
MLVVSVGIGPGFVGVTTAANAGVPADQAGLAAAALNAAQQLGGARPTRAAKPAKPSWMRNPSQPCHNREREVNPSADSS